MKDATRGRLIVGGILLGSTAVGALTVYLLGRSTKDPSACDPNTYQRICPKNPVAPPAGYRAWNGAPSSAVAAASQSLKYNLGTWVPIDSESGVLLEWHYHEPCGPLKPWGCHKGATLYRKS